MKGASPVLTYEETAELFETTRQAIAELVKAHNLSTKRVPRNGKAKGLDIDDLRVLAKAMNKPAPKIDDLRRLAVA